MRYMSAHVVGSRCVMPDCPRPRFMDGLCAPCWRLHNAMGSPTLDFIRDTMAEITSLTNGDQSP